MNPDEIFLKKKILRISGAGQGQIFAITFGCIKMLKLIYSLKRKQSRVKSMASGGYERIFIYVLTSF